MPTLRAGAAAVLVVVAVVLQVSALPRIAVGGVVGDLALLVTVGCALSRGPEFGALTGFAGGLLLDLAPPADHTAGRWALALALSGYLAGLARREAPAGPWQLALTVVLATVSAQLVFAATGGLLDDPGADRAAFGTRVGLAVGYDLLAAVVVVPMVMWGLARLGPARERRVPL